MTLDKIRIAHLMRVCETTEQGLFIRYLFNLHGITKMRNKDIRWKVIIWPN